MKVLSLETLYGEITMVKKAKQWIPVDAKLLAREIPGFNQLNDKAREKKAKVFLDSCDRVVEAEAPAYPRNAAYKVLDSQGKRRHLDASENAQAVQQLLHTCELFANPRAGYLTLTYLLVGLHGREFHQAAPDIRFALNILNQSQPVVDIFQIITEDTVTRKKWKGNSCTLKRKAILNCCSQKTIGNRLLDFSRYEVEIPKHPNRYFSKMTKQNIPAPYVDTVATIVCADSAFLREASAYMDCCATFLVGCGSNDWGAAKLTASETAEYDPTIVQELKNMRYPIASILRDWWGAYDKKEEKIWAQNVVARARKSFGKPDSRYITAVIDPKKLRDKIAYFVLLDFLDYTVKQGWITEEAAQVYRAGAQAVFDPQPVEDKPLRRMQQVDVFREIMEMLRQENADKIVPCGENFAKSAKSFGAYREISGEQYLVMLENDWSKAYPKAAKKLNVDVSFAQRPNWERELQKLLCETEAIKAPSAGYRYRYDLYDNGTRDKTYVIAYPIIP